MILRGLFLGAFLIVGAGQPAAHALGEAPEPCSQTFQQFLIQADRMADLYSALHPEQRIARVNSAQAGEETPSLVTIPFDFPEIKALKITTEEADLLFAAEWMPPSYRLSLANHFSISISDRDRQTLMENSNLWIELFRATGLNYRETQALYQIFTEGKPFQISESLKQLKVMPNLQHIALKYLALARYRANRDGMTEEQQQLA